jgi:hypothetical protein
LILSGAAACGVVEYPHDQEKVDSSNDFGPIPSGGTIGGTSGNGGTVPPTSQQSAAAGSGGRAGAPTSSTVAGRGGTGAAGAGTPVAAGSGGQKASAAGAMAVAGAPAAGMAAPPPAADALNLGGTAVAKEDVIAFIHIGHSNMAGRATGPSASRAYFFTQTDPHAWMYHVGKMPELAKEPYTAGDDLSGTYGGPGTALIKQAVQMAPNKYFMSLGFGKSSAYCSQFLPGSLYYDSLSKAAIGIKDRVTFGAIVIMLGITERHGTAGDISGYSGCINKLVTAIRTDVGRPDLPLLITDYEQEASGQLSVSSSFAQMIIPEIHKIPMVVSNSVLVPTDGLAMQDDHHFNFDGHKMWTQRLLDLMKSKGWFPWAK